jgi:hypothetical protein
MRLGAELRHRGKKRRAALDELLGRPPDHRQLGRCLQAVAERAIDALVALERRSRSDALAEILAAARSDVVAELLPR